MSVYFCFTNGGRLRGDSAQMERMYCFHDPAETDDSTMLDVVHARTTDLWKDSRNMAQGCPMRCITSMNVQYARRSSLTANFAEDSTKLFLVPKSQALTQQWRSLPEGYLVWDLDVNNLVPPLDAEFAADYESVRKVLKVGEAFCQDADLAFSQAQSNEPMRGTTKRDGQDVDTRW